MGDPPTAMENRSQGMKIGAIILIVGISIAVISFNVEKDQERAVYEQRMEYLRQKYPPGVYRPPSVAEYLFAPIPPQSAMGGVYLGEFLAAVGALIIFIKFVQKL